MCVNFIEYGRDGLFDNLVLDSSTLSDPVANHDSDIRIAPGHCSRAHHRIIYLNSTQPLKYQNNKIRL